MRLRVVVRRHALPETPVVWDIDTQNAAPIISTLLEEINEIIPIESPEWGLEDYAVELKGGDGTNFELLHFQPVAKVLHEDDEVIIRPLLTQDIRVRRISGRYQISTDGRHLVDGIPFGAPLIRKPRGRPAINIPPRKKWRITYDEDEEGNEVPLVLEENGASIETSERQMITHEDSDDDDSEDDEDFEPGEDEDEDGNDTEDMKVDLNESVDEDREGASRQLVVHADFLDQDEEDDEDFESGDLEDQDGDEEENLDVDMDVNPESEKEEEEVVEEEEVAPTSDEDVLHGVSDKARANILILFDAFPKARLGLCKLIYDGTNGDMDAAFTALEKGFKPAKSRSVVVGFESSTPSTKKQSKRKRISSRKLAKKDSAADAPYSVPSSESPTNGVDAKDANDGTKEVIEDSDLDEQLPENQNDSLFDYYDQNGLPPGSIKSGTALSHMATIAAKGSPARSRLGAKRSASVTSSKGVRFAEDQSPIVHEQNLALDSKPEEDGSIEKKSLEDNSSDTSSSGSSDSDSDGESDSSSEDDEDDDSKDGDDAKSSSKSESESDSDSSRLSSNSESDSEPDEVSSKNTAASAEKVKPGQKNKTNGVQQQHAPGKGKPSTKKRNQRKRNANVLERFKAKGILPAGTTTAEFLQLDGVNEKTSPEVAIAALESVRATNEAKAPEKSKKSIARDAEFEARRQALLASLASGGVEVGNEPSSKARGSSLINVKDKPNDSTANAVSQPAPETMPMEVNRDHQTAPLPNEESEMELDVVAQPKEFAIGETRKLSLVDGAEVQVARSSPAPERTIPQTLSSQPTPLSTSTESTQNSSAPQRRAKLDMGAGRRLLFGALGIKTPKIKSDEDKVRSDLMKYVRPEKTKERTPEPVLDANENEDPDAWKEKIIYRAAECCHEGIELSEPPFPFVQRWDPQQQGSWSKKAKRGGKRKKNQRNQDQFYNEEEQASKRQKRKDKRDYAETQESFTSLDLTPFEQGDDYLDASYVPSQPSHQENSMILDSIDTGDNPSQQTALHSDNIDDQISEQLMHDVSGFPAEDPFSVASQGLDEDDLPALPDNIATLPDLKAEDPKVGMVVAFKHLEMSEATKWQPQMSDYRTAVVIKVLDGGALELTLAKRDRVQSDKQYDEETGQRIYGKFEMPYDDEDEQYDDGYLDLSFSELVEPKLVQAAPPSLSVEGDDGEKSSANAVVSIEESTTLKKDINSDHHEQPEDSLVPETQVQATDNSFLGHVPSTESEQLENQKPMEEDTEAAPPGTPSKAKETEPNVLQQSTNDDVASQASQYEDAPLIADVITEPPSEGTRQRITDMIKEAGFRSSVPSSVLRDMRRPNGTESPGDAAVFEKLLKDMSEIEKGSSYSPKFNGFGSSPPADGETEGSSPIRGPRSRNPAANPIAQASYATANEDVLSAPDTSSGPRASLDDTEERGSTTSAHYPKLSLASSLASQASDHGRQPDFEPDDAMMMDDSEYSILKKYDEAGSASADPEPELPPRKSVSESPSNLPNGSPALAALSSDDSLPSLEQVFASQNQIKKERQTPAPSQAPSTKINKEYEAAVAALSDEDSDQSTPKASQSPTRILRKFPGLAKTQANWEGLQPPKRRTLSGVLNDAALPSKSNISQSQPPLRSSSQSQVRAPPKASQPKTRVASSQPVIKKSDSQKSKMVISEGSQVWDLTLSSDADPDSDTENKKDDSKKDNDIKQPYYSKFQKYESDDDDFQLDEGLPKGSGWNEKNTGAGRTSRRRTTDLASTSLPKANTRRRTAGGRF